MILLIEHLLLPIDHMLYGPPITLLALQIKV
jgi:hypothetical protein